MVSGTSDSRHLDDRGGIGPACVQAGPGVPAARAVPLLTLAAILACTAPAWAAGPGTYKWVDEKGVTHYSDTLPPQYVNNANTVLDRRALPVDATPAALTPEQRKARAAEAARQAEIERKSEDRRREQIALLNLYSDAGEIDRVRERSIAPIESKIQAAMEKVKRAQVEREQLEGLLEFYNGVDKTGKPRVPPTDLLRALEVRKLEYKSESDLVEALRQQQATIRTRYEDEKRRYLEAKRAQANWEAANLPK
jgi:Domain of unknown function (DUF4124)